MMLLTKDYKVAFIVTSKPSQQLQESLLNNYKKAFSTCREEIARLAQFLHIISWQIINTILMCMLK